MKRILTLILAAAAITCAFIAAPRQAAAGTFELSLGFQFNRTQYDGLGFSWVRRWGSSVGYHFNDKSEVEFSFQDVVDRTKITGSEDTTFHDQIYSLNWVQAFTGKNFPIQPYVKIGVGQLNRSATGSYANGTEPPRIMDSVTGVLAGGLRIYIMRNFALRGEATSYLARGSIRTWKDNLAFTSGVSFYF